MSDVTFLRALVMTVWVKTYVERCAIAGCSKYSVGWGVSTREALLCSVVEYWDTLAKEHEGQCVLEENSIVILVQEAWLVLVVDEIGKQKF